MDPSILTVRICRHDEILRQQVNAEVFSRETTYNLNFSDEAKAIKFKSNRHKQPHPGSGTDFSQALFQEFSLEDLDEIQGVTLCCHWAGEPCATVRSYKAIKAEQRRHLTTRTLVFHVGIQIKITFRSGTNWNAATQDWASTQDLADLAPTTVTVPSHQLVGDLPPDVFQPRLLELARQHASLLGGVQAGSRQFSFTSALKVPHGGQRFVSLDDNELRLHVVEDIFEGRLVPGSLQAVVTYEVVDGDFGGQEAVVRKTQPREYDFCRLGNLNDGDAGEEKSTSMALGADPNAIHSDWALLMWRDRANANQFSPFTTPVFAFGRDFCIGESMNDTFWELKEFMRRDHYLPAFRGPPWSIARLEAEIRRQLVQTARPGVPLSLTYNFNNLDATNGPRCGLDVSTGNKALRIAVRCVNRVAGINPALHTLFPLNLIFTLEGTDDATDVRRLVNHARQVKQISGRDLSRLWAKECELKLWICPNSQPQNGISGRDVRQLFLYALPNGDSLPLGFYLSREEIDKGHRRLYLEAHVVPSRDVPYTCTGTVRRFGEATEKDEQEIGESEVDEPAEDDRREDQPAEDGQSEDRSEEDDQREDELDNDGQRDLAPEDDDQREEVEEGEGEELEEEGEEEEEGKEEGEEEEEEEDGEEEEKGEEEQDVRPRKRARWG